MPVLIVPSSAEDAARIGRERARSHLHVTERMGGLSVSEGAPALPANVDAHEAMECVLPAHGACVHRETHLNAGARLIPNIGTPERQGLADRIGLGSPVVHPPFRPRPAAGTV